MRKWLIPLLLCAPSAAHAETRVLGVEDVVALAVQENPRLTASRARASAADSGRASAGGRLLPSIFVSDEYQHWNQPFTVPFGNLTVRDLNTNTFAAVASQPLLGLLRRSEDYKAGARSAEAALEGVRVNESALREALEVEYLRLFEALALRDIAKSSQAELAQQVSNTEAKVKAGTQTNADLLRVQVALSNARQQEIAAFTQSRISRARLLSSVGIDPEDVSVEFREPKSLLVAAEQPVDAKPSAPDNRPELRQAALRVEVAAHEARARGYALLPEVNLDAGYTRMDGQAFAPKNSLFVGLKAEWAVWDWGANWNAEHAASSQHVAAKADLESERRQIQVEVTARKAELESAASAVQLAAQAVSSASEAYRVTDALVRAGDGTTTDLLHAQAALTEARLSFTRARYERAIAHVALERARGLR